MATTVAPNRPRRRSQQPRVSVRGREDSDGAVSRASRDHDHEYDLLTAALVGITLGATMTYLLRRGPTGRRPVAPLIDGIGRGASWAGVKAARLSGKGARWASDRGEDLWDRVPRDEIREHVSEYLGRAREAIDDFVDHELHDLQKAVRRQRKRFGI